MAAARHPTAFVTWAHSGDGWTDDNARAWADEIRTFCIVLRGLGIDVEADVFHFDEPGINWDHFGPRAIADRDFTIVAASVPWKERWDGRNDPRVGAGAVAEANQLHGMFARDQQQFAERVVIVELPMAIGRGGVPDGLSGVPRFEVREVSLDGLEGLLRLLTDQPRNPLPQVGEIPVLPPASHPVPSPPTPASEPATVEDAAALAEITDQIGALRATLRRIPAPEPGEDPELPWYRAWHRVESELTRLEEQREGLVRHGAGQPGLEQATPSAASPAVATASVALPALPVPRELLDRAPQTPGAPEHWMLYDGVLLLRVVMATVPEGLRHRPSAPLGSALERATATIASLAAERWRPNAPTLLLDNIASDWATREPRIWQAGMSSARPESLQSRPTAAAALDTRGPVMAVDRTWNNKVERDPTVGGGVYYAAYLCRRLVSSVRLRFLGSPGMNVVRVRPGLCSRSVPRALHNKVRACGRRILVGWSGPKLRRSMTRAGRRVLSS